MRSLYRKGNFQGPDYRRQMNNHWPFAEIKRQIEYKAQWQGVPIIQLTKGETRGTSSLCPRCGERLQSDKAHRREVWCEKCKRWMDRDMVAVMNISRKGWLRFDHSEGKGIGGEAVNGNPTTTVILRVDPMKLMSLRVKEEALNASNSSFYRRRINRTKCLVARIKSEQDPRKS